MWRRWVAKWIVGLLLMTALLALVAANAGAATISAASAFIADLGATTTVEVVLDQAPAGLSGYAITVSLSEPAVAEITAMAFPGWVTMSDKSALPADSLWVKAVDLGHDVEAGATNVLLVTLTIRGDAAGICLITVATDRVEDDNGDPIALTVSPGTLRVGETDAVFRVDGAGRVFADGAVYGSAYLTGAADVAEWVFVSEPVEAGDVLAVDVDNPMKYRRAAGLLTAFVAGVVSTAPAVVLGGTGTPGQALLALVGIVPVKVTNEGGAIQPGDLLVSASTPGYAMRWAGPEACACPLVGKALEPMAGERGVILVLLASH